VYRQGSFWHSGGHSSARGARPPQAAGAAAAPWPAVDRTESYDPPSLGPGTWSTTYAYDLDRKVAQITRPDGLTIGLGYDVARRLETITSPRGTASITYDPDTGHVASITTPEGNGLHYEMDGPHVRRRRAHRHRRP